MRYFPYFMQWQNCKYLCILNSKNPTTLLAQRELGFSFQNLNIFGSNFVLENLPVCRNKFPRFSLFKIQIISSFGYQEKSAHFLRKRGSDFGSKYVQILDSETVQIHDSETV